MQLTTRNGSVRADIDISGLDEANEFNIGAYVQYNDDDDNMSTYDKDPKGTIDDENDLLDMTLRRVQKKIADSG